MKKDLNLLEEILKSLMLTFNDICEKDNIDREIRRNLLEARIRTSKALILVKRAKNEADILQVKILFGQIMQFTNSYIQFKMSKTI